MILLYSHKITPDCILVLFWQRKYFLSNVDLDGIPEQVNSKLVKFLMNPTHFQQFAFKMIQPANPQMCWVWPYPPLYPLNLTHRSSPNMHQHSLGFCTGNVVIFLVSSYSIYVGFVCSTPIWRFVPATVLSSLHSAATYGYSTFKRLIPLKSEHSPLTLFLCHYTGMSCTYVC